MDFEQHGGSLLSRWRSKRCVEHVCVSMMFMMMMMMMMMMNKNECESKMRLRMKEAKVDMMAIDLRSIDFA